MTKKQKSSQKIEETVWDGERVSVKGGRLKRPKGRPGQILPLLKVVGEKLPLESIGKIEKSINDMNWPKTGVYILHDSMGAPRYIGRGNIFDRVRVRARAYPQELVHFSFYVVEAKIHEREIETLLIRGASNMLEFNDRKKRVGIETNRIGDFEPGTEFYIRRDKR